MIVLDTNVLSELMRPAPAPVVIRWIAGHATTSLFTTTITQAEILYGLELLPEGRRRHSLATAIEAIFREDLRDRILPFDSAAARVYGPIVAARRRSGRPISQMDAQIAAVARSREATVATRNVLDFEGCGVEVIDPFG